MYSSSTSVHFCYLFVLEASFFPSVLTYLSNLQKNVKRYLRRLFRAGYFKNFVYLSGKSVNDFKARNFDALKGIWEEKILVCVVQCGTDTSI